MITIKIKTCTAWCGNLKTESDWQLWANGKLLLQDSDELPSLTNIPAMQRRRLSRFAKLSIHCALSVLENNDIKLPCVFASRHGDLHKTAKLIEQVSHNEDLSPTQFGLSVHNAVAGLYSMFDNNTNAMTAVASGEDTLLMAIVDAYAKMESQQLEQLLLVYTDEIFPELYQEFSSVGDKTLSMALLLERCADDTALKINFKRTNNKNLSEKIPAGTQSQKAISESVFQPLSFLRFWYSDMTEDVIESSRYQWQLVK